jgi:hypothetical protein
MADQNLPLIMTINGPQPTPPAALQDSIINQVAALSPGYTARLPGILIEDISSTDVAACSLMDSARVETINSLTPYGANAFLLNELGQIYGVSLGAASNTSVQIVFNGPPGFVIQKYFLVSDGTYTYQATHGGNILSTGQSLPLNFLALQSGSWAVLSGTVTNIDTSVPQAVLDYPLTCSNPLAGTPGQTSQLLGSYRAQVLTAGLAAGLGMPSYTKTQLLNVPGVQARLISIQQQSPGWKMIVGGGDPYAVAGAILNGILDISSLVGSTMTVVNVTQAANGVVTTLLNHGFPNGQVVQIFGVTQGMIGINGVPLTVTVINENQFSTGVSTTLFGTYISGGYLLPNFRNQVISLNNYPDTYNVTFVTPPLQTVAMTILWNTIATNFLNEAAIAQLAAPAIATYVNSVPVGQPLNLYQMQTAFQQAIAPALSPQLLTSLNFEVDINGIGVVPVVGTGMIEGDPESYFYTEPAGSQITILQA